MLLVLTQGVPERAAAAEEHQEAVFTFLEENDMAVRTDRHYTQGIKFSFLQADDLLPRWIGRLSEAIPPLGFEAERLKWGYDVGQNIYTPQDTSETELITDDRPYAGWLYIGFVLQRRGTMLGWPSLESYELNLGVIGPESLAEQAQTWVHRTRGIDLPQGWDNQLKTEPGVALKYYRGSRLAWSESSSRYFDFIPHFGASLGNVETALRVGGTIRAGVNLPHDFGVQTISSLLTTEGGQLTPRPKSSLGAYAFAGVEGWFVAYTAFLDGNLYQDSHSVDKQPFVVEAKFGGAVYWGWMDIGAAYVYRTPEFKNQELDSGYGSIFIKIRL